MKHYEDGVIELVEESELPVTLPELEKFEPGVNGESPLANSTAWLFGEDKKVSFAAKPTPCRNGPDRAGITFATSIQRTTRNLFRRRL